jgi:hypothetical protein
MTFTRFTREISDELKAQRIEPVEQNKQCVTHSEAVELFLGFIRTKIFPTSSLLKSNFLRDFMKHRKFPKLNSKEKPSKLFTFLHITKVVLSS